MELTKFDSLTLSQAKALGIIAVVIGHTSYYFPGSLFVYLFHMPFFFFLAGITFRPERPFGGLLKSTFSKIFLYIAVTYALQYLIFSILNYVSVIPSDFIYNESALPEGFAAHYFPLLEKHFASKYAYFLPSLNVLWFLIAYAFASMLSWCIVGMTLRSVPNKYLDVVLVFAALFCGYIGMKYIPSIYASYFYKKLYIYAQLANTMSQVLTASMFYVLGYILRRVVFKYIYNIYLCLLVSLIIASMYSSGLISTIGMHFSYYPNGFLVEIMICFGCFYVCFCVARLSAFLDNKQLFKIIGDNSKSIMSYHNVILYLAIGLTDKIGKSFLLFCQPLLIIVISILFPALCRFFFISKEIFFKNLFKQLVKEAS